MLRGFASIYYLFCLRIYVVNCYLLERNYSPGRYISYIIKYLLYFKAINQNLSINNNIWGDWMSNQNHLDPQAEQEAANSVKKLCRSIVQKIELIENNEKDNAHEQIRQDQAVGISLFVYMRENQKKLKEKYASLDQSQIIRNLLRKWKKLPEVEKDKYLEIGKSQNLNRKSKKKRKQEKKRKIYSAIIHELKEQKNPQDKQQLRLDFKEEGCILQSQTSDSSVENKNKEMIMDKFVIKNTEYKRVENKILLMAQSEQKMIVRLMLSNRGGLNKQMLKQTCIIHKYQTRTIIIENKISLQ